MAVSEREVRDGKITSESVLPAVDPDCTHCWQNRPSNYFVVNGKIDTYKSFFSADFITSTKCLTWVSFRVSCPRLVQPKCLTRLRKAMKDADGSLWMRPFLPQLTANTIQY